MKAEETKLKDVLVIKPKIFEDSRGFFLESFNEKTLQELGLHLNFVQENHSRSSKNVLRGLHFQKNKPQGKLVRCSRGSVLDVVADINPNSKTFKQFFSIELNDSNHYQLWIPPGYAHGFIALSEVVDFQYKCTEAYDPSDQYGISWNDESLNIDWKTRSPLLSKKDRNNPTLSTFLDR